jgi:hypothetical protein
VVGSPTHPVMPNLVMLWKMSPLRRAVRAGARVGAPPPTRRASEILGPCWAQLFREQGGLVHEGLIARALSLHAPRSLIDLGG